jgi:hypothetical protein
MRRHHPWLRGQSVIFTALMHRRGLALVHRRGPRHRHAWMCHIQSGDVGQDGARAPVSCHKYHFDWQFVAAVPHTAAVVLHKNDY